MPIASRIALRGWDHVEFYVGNAKQAAHYYRTAFGFRPVAYAGPETGVTDHASYVLAQGSIRFVLTAGLEPDHLAVRHQAAHGDGVRAVAFAVDDADAAFRSLVANGAHPVAPPTEEHDDDGTIVTASIAAYGDTVHTFVQRDAYHGPFRPGYSALAGDPHDANAFGTGLREIDHVVANVPDGTMDEWSRFYADLLGFSELVHFDDSQIGTEYTALRSRVMWDGHGAVKLPINEPAEGRRTSQITEYLDFYRGPGVQHLALATDDIVTTVKALRANGVEFLDTPASYYELQRDRLDWSAIGADVDVLAELGILVDVDDRGYLLQIFTKPVEDRPTVFYEIIERRGCEGFGVGNFQALFESIEREQARRGTL
jgi:4-hydroxyphenylpyruvate dioxygenase